MSRKTLRKRLDWILGMTSNVHHRHHPWGHRCACAGQGVESPFRIIVMIVISDEQLGPVRQRFLPEARDAGKTCLCLSYLAAIQSKDSVPF